MACILLHEMLKGLPSREESFAEMAYTMSQERDLEMPASEIKKTLSGMEECGLRYCRCESDLGGGASIVLGKGLTESQ